MNAILTSIKPERVMKILSGEKTIDVENTAPNCYLPVDVYIYCTEGNGNLWRSKSDRSLLLTRVGGAPYTSIPLHDAYDKLNGKVVAKFKLWGIERFSVIYPCSEPTFSILQKACLTVGEARRYAGGKRPYYKSLYAWYIEDLVIFDEPKDLSEFYLKKPPQSWCYVEETKKEEKQ